MPDVYVNNYKTCFHRYHWKRPINTCKLETIPVKPLKPHALKKERLAVLIPDTWLGNNLNISPGLEVHFYFLSLLFDCQGLFRFCGDLK